MAEETDTNDKATMESIAQNVLEVRVSRDRDGARQRNSVFRSAESDPCSRDTPLIPIFPVILTDQCRRWVRIERSGRVRVPSLAGDIEAPGGRGEGGRRRRDYLEQSLGLPITVENPR